LSYAQLTAGTYQLHADDRFGNHSPIHFDISTLGYFTAPYLGATTVIVPDAHTKLPASLSQLIEKEQLTVWYSVPLALTQLLHLGVLEERDLSNLRWVFFAGETFPTKYLKALMNLLPTAEFSNIYGPAETNQCTYFNMDCPPVSDAPIPLGQIWKDTEMLIIDEQDQEVTPGQTGELLIRSATMMEGYWKKPELSDRGFFKKELLPGFSKTFYRTGDLVRQDEGGCLHFLGRRDQQVKVRGYRVELEAVENLMAAQEIVREAIVFPYRNKKEEVVIIGVVRLQEQVEATENDLLTMIKDQLPHYALPQNIFFLDDFPRTGTGKVNRPTLKDNLLKQIEEIHG
jgi:acyl-coenzyme A synthetase/AMP-(fatty) acid ligase